MFKSFAPRITHIDGDVVADPTAAILIQSGEPIRVFGFIISKTGTTAMTYTFADANGNTLFVLNLTHQTPKSFYIPFIADKGLQITMNSDAGEITIFHSQEGT